MSLELISEKIISKAKDFEKETEKKLDQESKKLKKESDENLKNIKEKLSNENQQELDFEVNKILSSSNTSSKRIILETYSKTLNETFSKSLEKLENLEKKEREKFLQSLVKKIEDEKINYSLVYANINDIQFLEKKLKKGCKVLPKKKFHGLELISENGKTKIDLSFEQLLKEKFDEKEIEIRKLLFDF